MVPKQFGTIYFSFHNMKLSFLLVILGLLCMLNTQAQPRNDLEYFESIHSADDVEKYILRAYTDTIIYPIASEEFDEMRSKTVGEKFVDPNFGREWTLLTEQGHNIMNSERNIWNSDHSLFALIVISGNAFKINLFEGSSGEFVKTINFAKPYSNITELRWMPHDPERMFYLFSNKLYTLQVHTGEVEVYETFKSFTLKGKKVAKGDGNDVAPNGDFLICNGGEDCFVYNLKERKVITHDNLKRVTHDPSLSFPTFDLGELDYALAFGGFIIELDEDSGSGGTVLRDYNGELIQELYRRTPHFDPTYFKASGTLYPGLMVRYNKADANHYTTKGYDTEESRAYFHGWDPDNPAKFVRFEMDPYPSSTLSSGGQHSANRFDGTTGIVNMHGPALYGLTPWDKRYGECYEQAYHEGEAILPRRFAHHYIAYETKNSSSSEQPEGWISPSGTFAVIKTRWGWYKIELSNSRLTRSELASYRAALNVPPYRLGIVVMGDGEVHQTPAADEYDEGVQVALKAVPDEGYEFQYWSGDAQGADNPLTITMDGRKNVIAHFISIAESRARQLEAEEAVLSLANVSANIPGYSGDGFVDFINTAGGSIKWEVAMDFAGVYEASIVYANPSAQDRTMIATLDNRFLDTVQFSSTGSLSNWGEQLIYLPLSSGSHQLELSAITNEGGPNIDYLKVPYLPVETVLSSSQKPLFRVYPNPFVDQITIRPGVAGDTRIAVELVAMDHKVVFSDEIHVLSHQQEVVLDLEDDTLSPGLYVLKISSATSQQSILLLQKK